MRRATVGLIASLGLALLSGCAPLPEGAVEAQAYECPLGEEGCDELRPVGPGGTFEVEMGEYYFEQIGGTPVTGEIEVSAINEGPGAYHNIEFLGAPEGSFMGGSDERAVAGAQVGETGEGVVELFPGEWTIICNVPGHRQAGMEATITVYATEEEAEQAAEEGDDDPEAEPAA